MTSRAAAAAGRLGKHSLSIAGHRTSISLEDAFWDALCSEAARRAQPVAALVAGIDTARGDANLCSAIRVFVLRCAEARAGTAAEPLDEAPRSVLPPLS